MAIQNIIKKTVDLSRGVKLERLNRLFAQNDSAACTFLITVLQDGEAVDLTGCTINCYVIRSDNSTIEVEGTVSGNVATVVLSSSCYSIVGRFDMMVKAVSSDSETAIYWADGNVTRSYSEYTGA